ncbi:MAG: 50S ribosomal protein L4 [Clostridia bacterium]|nr:50S ribosomal protein L4 [Clostridia bacterium]MBQ2914037.1 50S ribosomal protein L4 [Clostridia bacterium]MBQ4272724.1 50S ribosomal protein L4 [Clostridia bacterium]MBR1955042.1 50S ribosomal protein L4 [Clostridia bacterium]MBR2985826.1 50S ribosomal protein L4 [Clostridia bacterium]
MKVKVYNTSAVEVGSVELNDAVFGCDYNEALIHQAVVAYQANQRQGTKSALTRTEVRGGGIKPWRQKGTGRARQGSIRAPQWIKGGVVFAPKPRDFSKKLNKKMKAAAFRSAISTKIANGELVVVDAIALEAPKTKLVANILKNFNYDQKTLLVVSNQSDVARAGANIAKLTVTEATLANVYQLVSNVAVIVTVDALKQIEEAYSL